MGERDSAFAQLDWRTQYAVYRYGMRREPPALELTVPLARHGDSLASLLSDRAEMGMTDAEVIDALFALNDVEQQGTHDVANDTVLLRRMSSRVGRMRDAEWRTYCDSLVRALGHSRREGEAPRTRR